MASSVIMNSYYLIHPNAGHNYLILRKNVILIFSSSRCLSFMWILRLFSNVHTDVSIGKMWCGDAQTHHSDVPRVISSSEDAMKATCYSAKTLHHPQLRSFSRAISLPVGSNFDAETVTAATPRWQVAESFRPGE